jgi:hypothetical protein
MRPYVRKKLPNQDVIIFNRIKNAIDNLPNLVLGKDEEGRNIDISCHILARAIAKAFGLRYADGYFCRNYQHSWVLTGQRNIIDVYPVGIFGGPLLISCDINSPTSFLYRRHFLTKKFKRPSFVRAVKVVTSFIMLNHNLFDCYADHRFFARA